MPPHRPFPGLPTGGMLIVAAGFLAAGSADALPPLPSGWPTTLQLGVTDGSGDAARLATDAPYGFRYQYLSGGVNTGGGWATWNANGSFASNYIQESIQAGITPVFTYYMLYQSTPGHSLSEDDGN